eukprot:scaffold322475_cov24-Prasinocladus_malaysianus.AAC.1
MKDRLSSPRRDCTPDHVKNVFSGSVESVIMLVGSVLMKICLKNKQTYCNQIKHIAHTAGVEVSDEDLASLYDFQRRMLYNESEEHSWTYATSKWLLFRSM